jgi:ubiquinone/menaquinone biosynthesis C-methylase UbiE
MAEAAGENGKVYAVDNSDRMQEAINARKPPPQLIPVMADVLETGLDDGIADICLLAFILHEVREQEKLIAEAYRLIKPGGRIIVVEWRIDSEQPSPPKHRRISRERIEELFASAGLKLTDYIERTKAHYAAIGEKDGG